MADEIQEGFSTPEVKITRDRRNSEPGKLVLEMELAVGDIRYLLRGVDFTEMREAGMDDEAIAKALRLALEDSIGPERIKEVLEDKYLDILQKRYETLEDLEVEVLEYPDLESLGDARYKLELTLTYVSEIENVYLRTEIEKFFQEGLAYDPILESGA